MSAPCSSGSCVDVLPARALDPTMDRSRWPTCRRARRPHVLLLWHLRHDWPWNYMSGLSMLHHVTRGGMLFTMPQLARSIWRMAGCRLRAPLQVFARS